MDTSTLFITAIISLIIWAVIIYSIISSATHAKEVVGLLTLIAKKQGATDDEIFRATKTKDQIYARDLMLKRELKKKQKEATI
jgi:hypothetical protein